MTLPTLGSLGEWGFLRYLLPRLARRRVPGITVGPGDDAAVIEAAPGVLWAVTTDILVEGVHFKKAWTSGEDLGHKALAVNLSDLAAMGDVRPRFAVVALGAPGSTPVSYLKGMYRGMDRLARRHGVAVVGGDTVRARDVTVSVALWGEVKRGSSVVRRSGARRGDWLMVTGALGDARAGLDVLTQGRPRGLSPEMARRLIATLRRPRPRLDAAPVLARAGVHAMTDSSDGLWRSARLLAEASGLGVVVRREDLPVGPALVRWARAKGVNARETALWGGEEYELVLAASPTVGKDLRKRGWAFPVGVFGGGKAIEVQRNDDGRTVERGFEHFIAS
jgi:thiamine-monophosphate kinase